MIKNMIYFYYVVFQLKQQHLARSFELILHSKIEEAKKFQKWVYIEGKTKS